MLDTNTLVDQLSGLTILEVADLVKKLEEKWALARGSCRSCRSRSCCGGAAAAPAEEKTAFDVILKEAGGNKIAVIKEFAQRCRTGPCRREDAC